MDTASVEPFADNWAYLRTELLWLDRVLSLAIAKQRKDTRDIDRVTKNRADQVTSHWWKGLVTLEGETAYDTAPKPTRGTKGSYQQQLEAKIRVSQAQGVDLGLPHLCDRLHLSVFEKNLVMMLLAPEISQRYNRIYNFLQQPDFSDPGGILRVDLVLRILCRTDREWRSGRTCLTATSGLVQTGLLTIRTSEAESFLARPIKLADELVNYLLAEQPTVLALDQLLQKFLPETTQHDSVQSFLNTWSPDTAAPNLSSRLILSQEVQTSLHQICRRFKAVNQVEQIWPKEDFETLSLGSIVLLVGIRGTGKMMAARVIAQTLQTVLVWVDLKYLSPVDQLHLLETLHHQAPPLLLIQSAQHWFGRSTSLSSSARYAFLEHRKKIHGITLLTIEHLSMIQPKWRRELTSTLMFALPTEADRLQLWQQAFPASTQMQVNLDWQALAKLSLTGGQIYTIAQEALLLATIESVACPDMGHIQQALKLVMADRPTNHRSLR